MRLHTWKFIVPVKYGDRLAQYHHRLSLMAKGKTCISQLAKPC